MMAHLPEGVSATDAASAGDNLSDAFRCVAEVLKKNRELPVLIVAGGGGAPSISLYAAALAARWVRAGSTTWTVTQHGLAIAQAIGANAIDMTRDRTQHTAVILRLVTRTPAAIRQARLTTAQTDRPTDAAPVAHLSWPGAGAARCHVSMRWHQIACAIASRAGSRSM